MINNIMMKLHQAGYRAYIAGGYLRDLDNSITPKDVDIFVVGCTTDQVLDNILSISRTIVNTAYPCKNYGGMRDDVLGFIKMESMDIICMKSTTIESVVLNFDASLCHIYSTIEGDVYISQDYAEYVKHGKWFMYNDIITTYSHGARIVDKYGPYSTKPMTLTKNDFFKYTKLTNLLTVGI